MVPNFILQTSMDGLSNIVKVPFAVYDMEGKIVASTYDGVEKYKEKVRAFIEAPAQSMEENGIFLQKIYDEMKACFVLLSEEEDPNHIYGRVGAFQIQELIHAYKEHFDRDNFIKNLLMDNLLLVDIYNRSKKLDIAMEVPRVVVMIEMDYSKDGVQLDLLREYYPENNGHFVTAVDEDNIILVLQLEEEETAEDVEQKAASILKLLHNAVNRHVRISYGSICYEIRDVSRSYKEAMMAMDIGNIFFKEKQIIAYTVLGIGRLIYQLPTPLCRMFIREIFQKKLPSDFDEETITTINKFFENSLNVSETSRQLFIHRNTLVYRLDKIQKATGLDLRVFEDAITFKIALMVVEYMKYMEESL